MGQEQRRLTVADMSLSSLLSSCWFFLLLLLMLLSGRQEVTTTNAFFASRRTIITNRRILPSTSTAPSTTSTTTSTQLHDNINTYEDPVRPYRTFTSDRNSYQPEHKDTEIQNLEDEQREREAIMNEILEKDDREYKEQMKKRKWGKYYNVTTKEEVAKLQQEEREVIEKENNQKAELAKQSGCSLEFLAPRQQPFQGLDIGRDTMVISSSMINKIDNELEEEWNALMIGANDDDFNNKNQESSSGMLMEENLEDLEQTTKTTLDSETGNVITKDLRGIRVGSADGGMLEVFPGDFVVHRKYGIGCYEGTTFASKTKLTEMELRAQQERRQQLLKRSNNPTELAKTFGTYEDKDPISNPQTTVLQITYADGIVQVPIDRAYRLSRYRGGNDGRSNPRLSRVRGDAWKKQRRKVEESTKKLAQDVLGLYAMRETLTRQPFDPELEHVVQNFSTTFPFTPTPDQKTCFEDVENDMVWRNRPMDRLICGDVGFGKTEVAMRAIVRAVANGKQAAFLAPTGVLAAQHYKNVLERMGPESSTVQYNITLLRGGMGRNSRAGREIRDAIGRGDYNVIVGTHALLSKDLEFHDLGLLVIDEEQRFGVRQKERLKLICSGIDVLTMSATPIPRTLQMSLSGIRDTSTIRSPPPMRKPTITTVEAISNDMIQSALFIELERGGQAYYVVPRIRQIGDAAERIEKLLPGIRIITAHGRMGRGQAEENVAAFAEGKYDVLLATTVIENGVDIPSVNTIIVQSAQRFGMSTLYQLRGRVGRSDVQAFAYFLSDHGPQTKESMARLSAISQLQELGSGFDVANRDLEIRGAGSLLGTEQSGVAARVGFDLYMRMLKRSIRKLRALDLPALPRSNILLPEASIEVEGPDGVSHAFRIPESYMTNEQERRREETIIRLAESTTALVNHTTRWKQEYGPIIPLKVQQRLKTMHVHACTRRLGIDLVGLMERKTDDDGKNGTTTLDCILRSPGLRPRHVGYICERLPRGRLPKGVIAIFPKRFCKDGRELRIIGGRKLDLSKLNNDNDDDDDDDDGSWDVQDQEEAEAMRDISSAYRVRDMNEVDVGQYPRFVIPNFGSIPGDKRVDILLKILLPPAKVVFEKQEQDMEKAKVAAELRQKSELMKENRKKKTKELQLEHRYWRYEDFTDEELDGTDETVQPYVF